MRTTPTNPQAVSGERDEAAYGRIEMRLPGRQWLVVAFLVAAVLAGLPVLGQRCVPLHAGEGYRIPYDRSNDYWLFQQYSRLVAARSQIVVLGDSVVWGQYVAADQTLTHCLNACVGGSRFANLGVDGMYPAAMTGLLDQYGQAITNAHVILHCNPLWFASKEHDLRAGKEFRFNHPELLPQFSAGISAYRASFGDRLDISVNRVLAFRPWVKHWRSSCLDGEDLASWTLQHPYDSPFGTGVDVASRDEQPRHSSASWKDRGATVQDFPWVDLSESPQWRGFRDVVDTLRTRSNSVLVVLGPFNEHMLSPRSLKAYGRLKEQTESWLRNSGVPVVSPAVLPSQDYADASHPLASGYTILARELLSNRAFAEFADMPRSRANQGAPP